MPTGKKRDPEASACLVGVQKYAIRYSKSLEALGEFDMDANEIRVRSGLDPISRATTLLHELLHAISDTLGGGLTEEQVRCVEQGFAMIIKDNPKILRGILRDLCGRK